MAVTLSASRSHRRAIAVCATLAKRLLTFNPFSGIQLYRTAPRQSVLLASGDVAVIAAAAVTGLHTGSTTTALRARIRTSEPTSWVPLWPSITCEAISPLAGPPTDLGMPLEVRPRAEHERAAFNRRVVT